ncbi:PREDICTED: synaptotagmin-5-like [Erythranthe guttata]|uniref:synaptotagmin-5-like n=1 Tax=Erythranthe guttata TaxID=4155 RepID=UPI00064DDF01|nr:PREDICTED: synaptotagmin-5-like [Erythranthe guttata]|eukprot:XP_012843447.1 PREDICTED: synaptotagmin-5-like [Erythranthe guttata]
MGFFVGYVLGFGLGMGLIVGFARFQNIRSKHRTDLAQLIAAFARMTVQDLRKLFPDDQSYPAWVVFSDKHKLTWLNHHLDKIWPYVDQAASEIIRNAVEPILEQYRSSIMSSLKFSKLTLGTVAPQFTGVSIIEGESNEIIMELELQWDGNPNIVLDIKTRVGVALPIQVKNIGFTGVFRLIFKPLVDEFPCFGAICYSLRQKESLDFTLKVVGGDVSSLPGICDALEETIRNAVEDFTWPVRQIIPILAGDYSYLELKPVGTLEVKLIEAKELTNKDIIGKSDPFVELFIRPLRDRIQTSKTINNQTNPIWNEHFEFVVEDFSTQHLTIRVYDNEGIQTSEFIGCAQLPLAELEPGKVKDVWLKLVKDLDIQRDQKNRGKVHLEILYYPLNGESELYNPFDPDFRLTLVEKAFKHANDTDPLKSASPMKRDVIIRGVLSVTVISAENLPATDLFGKSDPFVELTMKKSDQKNKTRVVSDTLNPEWNQTFEFVVEDGLHELLILEVYDHDTFGKEKMGRCIMTLTRAILEQEFRDTFPIDGTESGRLNLRLKWTPQTIIRD